MNRITKAMAELKKDILFFLDRQKLDPEDIEPMRQETPTEKIAPIAIMGVRNSPRMRYKRS